MSDPKTSEYGISAPKTDSLIAAPTIHYLPELPKNLSIPIALVGAGGIAEYHLKSYRDAGLNVVAIVDRNKDKAEARCQEFFPNATAYTDYIALLERDDIVVIDVATHVDSRLEIVTACLRAGKHVIQPKTLGYRSRSSRPLDSVSHGQQGLTSSQPERQMGTALFLHEKCDPFWYHWRSDLGRLLLTMGPNMDR